MKEIIADRLDRTYFLLSNSKIDNASYFTLTITLYNKHYNCTGHCTGALE